MHKATPMIEDEFLIRFRNAVPTPYRSFSTELKTDDELGA